MSGTRRARFYVYPDGLILPIVQGGGGTSLTQSVFRGRNDNGNLTGATWKDVADANWSQNVDENFRVRIGVLCEGMAASITPQLQYQHTPSGGSPGGWNNVNGSSSVVRPFAPATSIGEDASVAQIITAGTYVNGRFDQVDGATSAITYSTVPQSTEVEFCLQIRSADVADGDTVELRVTNGGTALNTYSQTPSITVVDEGGPPTGGTLNRWTGSVFVPGGTLKRWTGSVFAAGGTLRRWTGSGWEPPP